MEREREREGTDISRDSAMGGSEERESSQVVRRSEKFAWKG